MVRRTEIEEVSEKPEEIAAEQSQPKHKGRPRKAKAEENVVEETVPEVPVVEDPEKVIKEVLEKEPRRKGDLPTLIKYNPHGGRDSYMLIEVGEPTLRSAWTEYTHRCGDPNPDEFLGLVHSIIGDSRVFEGVVPMTL